MSTVVRRMIDDERSWSAMASFCEEVISRKEAAVREREDDLVYHPARWRRGESRRKAFAC